MVNLEKVTNQILNDGLYNTLLFEIKERLQREDVTHEMIKDLLIDSQDLIDEYKEINRQSEISNIQIKSLEISKNESQKALKIKSEINHNIQILKNLENFERDSKESAYLIWIGSVGVMVIFIIHNIIALFSELYTTHSLVVYGSYVLILFFTYIGYVKIKKNHDAKHEIFKRVYVKTKKALNDGIKNSLFRYEELYEK
jgi:amino acid permease